MRIDEDAANFLEQVTGMRALETKTGLEAFNRALVASISQIIVVHGHYDRILNTLELSEKTKKSDSPTGKLKDAETNKSDQASSPNATILTRTELTNAEPERKIVLMEDYLAGLVEEKLRLKSRLDREKALDNMGLNSLIAVELQKQIQRDLHLEIRITSLVKGVNIRNLASQIIELL